MTKDMRNEARIAEWADLYGGDIAAWPAEAQQEAEALLTGSAAARATLEEARLLDNVLRDFAADTKAPDPSPALMARILTDAAAATPAPVVQEPTRTGGIGFHWLRSLFEARMGPVTACIGGAVFGIWLGFGGAGEVAAEATMLALNEDFVMGLYTGGDVETTLSEMGFTELGVTE